MISKLIFLFSESIRGLFRAKIPALISSITIAIALVIFSLAYFSYVNLLGYSFKFKSNYKIEVFFEPTLEADQARDLFNTILILDGIEQGEFIDKEKAAKLFENYFNEDIVQIIGENPLPMGGQYDINPSFRFSKKMNKISKDIQFMDGVESVSFPQGIVSRVDSIIENMLGISMVLGFVIFFVAIILVSNTIRLIIHLKQVDIQTMHLLGATNSFIRFPFVIESLIQGLIGAGISILILYLLNSLQIYLLEPLIKLPLVQPPNLILYNIIFGIVLALIGSYRGISKYLLK